MTAARSRRVRHVLGYVVVLQLFAAVPLSLSSQTAPRVIKTVSLVRDETPTTAPSTTSTTTVPSTTSTTLVPRHASPERTSSIYGTIGAGEGGSGRVDLSDDAGTTWHRDANAYGVYRFDGLHAGHYRLDVTGESVDGGCGTSGICIGSALAIVKREATLAPGASQRIDVDFYGPTRPEAVAVAPATTSTTTG